MLCSWCGFTLRKRRRGWPQEDTILDGLHLAYMQQCWTYIIELVMDCLKEDAAQHGTGFAALLSMLVDESAQLRHDCWQILLQLKVRWYLDCDLVSLQSHSML